MINVETINAEATILDPSIFLWKQYARKTVQFICDIAITYPTHFPVSVHSIFSQFICLHLVLFVYGVGLPKSLIQSLFSGYIEDKNDFPKLLYWIISHVVFSL